LHVVQLYKKAKTHSYERNATTSTKGHKIGGLLDGTESLRLDCTKVVSTTDATERNCKRLPQMFSSFSLA